MSAVRTILLNGANHHEACSFHSADAVTDRDDEEMDHEGADGASSIDAIGESVEPKAEAVRPFNTSSATTRIQTPPAPCAPPIHTTDEAATADHGASRHLRQGAR